jgi:NADPH:quinone reductase-like Zn-dependent oxidoreductase
MKAAQISEFGHADKVKINEVDTPTIKPDQVLVEVHAASINPFDTAVREGNFEIPLPITLGGDIAGTVVEVGSQITHVAQGDKVYGQAHAVSGASGAFAEFAATGGEQVGKAPSNLDFKEAASLTLVGQSAMQVIQGHINLQPNQKILIHGGSGGIGSVAIQIAKHIGAHVATTANGEGVDYVKKLGADEVIDYKVQKFEDLLHDFDAIFDTVGGETYKRSYEVLKPGGVIVSMIEQPDHALMEQYKVTAIAQQTQTTPESLAKLTSLIESGVIAPHVDKVFPLEQIAQAFETRESGKVLGKVVLVIK